jgi:hypothetical protein
MKKWEIPNSFMWPFLDQLIWAALTPQGDRPMIKRLPGTKVVRIYF